MLPVQADNAEQLVPCQEALAEVLVENLTRRSGNQGVALLSDRLLKAGSMLSIMPYYCSLVMGRVWQVIQGSLGVSGVYCASSCRVSGVYCAASCQTARLLI